MAACSSVLPKSGIKPITASAKELNLKKNAGMTKALKELEIHQAMADKAAEERPLFADEEGDDADSGDDIHQEEVRISCVTFIEILFLRFFSGAHSAQK